MVLNYILVRCPCRSIIVTLKHSKSLMHVERAYVLKLDLRRRVILNQELACFSFSETSFDKHCHKGLTRVFQPEKVASRIGQISTPPHSFLVWQIGMCWMLQRMRELLRNMSAAMSRSEWFLGTGERTIFCCNIWSISAYVIVIASTENNLTFVFWPFSCAPDRAIVVPTGLQNMPKINRRVRQKLP